ncbi:hypothetical protein L6164_021786 [Bauhinia variegata]|uniref:Uncharacterized protein n=1 Tax=Bauhinia variegata TaxID=167791 RepID=A0ACB9MCV8_BAUVA|nr:hypothetical protein L6164_021786 [Bauhinia variegata]
MVGLNTPGNDHGNDAGSVMRPREKSLEVPASEFDHYSFIPSNDITPVEAMYYEGRNLQHPVVQNPVVHHEATYNFYNLSAGYRSNLDGQQPQVVNSEIRAENDAVPTPGVEGENTGGDLQYYVKDTFQNELDRPIDHSFLGSPINSLSLNYGDFDTLIGDDFFNEEDMIKYFGA